MLEMGLILKIGGIGMFVSILSTLLKSNGSTDWSQYIVIAGVIVVLGLIAGEVTSLLNTVQTMFNLY